MSIWAMHFKSIPKFCTFAKNFQNAISFKFIGAIR